MSASNWKIPAATIKPPDTLILLSGTPPKDGGQMTLKYTVLKQGEVIEDEFYVGDVPTVGKFLSEFTRWINPHETFSIRNGFCHNVESRAYPRIPTECFIPFCKATADLLHPQPAS